MLNFLLNNYHQRKGLISFFLLTYMDKAISFALPLSVLFIIRDKSLYGLIEVAFSYSTIAMVVVELGLSNYLFWGYKESVDKILFLGKAQIFFRASLFIYAIISALVFLYLRAYDNSLSMLFALISTRTLFVFFANFYSIIYRLEDKPSKIYFTTIPINLASFLLLAIGYRFYSDAAIIYFFFPPMILVLGISIKFLFKIKLFHFSEFVAFIKSALTFSWPIILNVLMMSFINNYGKIYAYGHLSAQEMLQVSYALRLGLIIQLSHVAYAAYFSKSLFMDARKRFNGVIFRQYSLILLFSVSIVVAAILFTNYWLAPEIYVPLDLATALFIFYIILWCYIGYLELYFGVMNANRSILIYSIVSSVLYISLLKFYGSVTLLQLAIFMVAATSLNLILVIIGLNRLNIFANAAGAIKEENPDLK